jgi:hypothetical protein
LTAAAAAACLCRKNKKASDGKRAPDTKYIHGDPVVVEEEVIMIGPGLELTLCNNLGITRLQYHPLFHQESHRSLPYVIVMVVVVAVGQSSDMDDGASSA